MADSNIGSLPQAQSLDDSSLLVAEQQGQAVKVTGAQFKEFGRQAVIGQVQGYVDQAEAAADRAAGAVSAVTEMTVEAHAGEAASVTKTMKNGRVNLDFGLPRGERGEIGPAGAAGPRGPQGPTGKGLTILGYYDTLADLQAAVPAPSPGDAYGVGLLAPYNIYVYDGVSNEWKDNGPLSGGGGVLPENVVTSEGGAEMEFAAVFGDAPHTVAFTEEEEPPLTAEDIGYGDGTVQEAMNSLFTSVSSGKALIASAITDKGVPTAQDAAFAQMAENIGQIGGGSDTSDATATSFDILAPKTAYTAAGKVEGTIPTLLGQTITPGTADKTIANGQYLGGTQVIKGDPNLTSGNIRKGVSLFGVAGALESTFQATLTVKADIGAVVTATHTDGTEVSALSQTGTVVFALPKEGTWKVTAVRGVAQYNTVTLKVSSQYSAELTAEVHIEHYGKGTNLNGGRGSIASSSLSAGNEEYALFGGGYVTYDVRNTVDVYDKYYTHTLSDNMAVARYNLAACQKPRYQTVVFAGGKDVNGKSLNLMEFYHYDGNGVVGPQGTTVNYLRTARSNLAAASVGETMLFAGGISGKEEINTVDAYTKSSSYVAPTVLAIPASDLAAASNDNYAIFAGGYSAGQYRAQVTAYDSELTRSTPTVLSAARSTLSAARAGNYVVFAGGYTGSIDHNTVDAYDLFLTRTTPEVLAGAGYLKASATLRDFALFGGGRPRSNDYAFLDTVDVYDPYLTHTLAQKLSTARYDLSAAAAGDAVFFAGGVYRYRTSVTSSEERMTPEVDIYRYI